MHSSLRKQIVPEWKSMYLNMKNLKGLIRRIKHSMLSPNGHKNNPSDRRVAMKFWKLLQIEMQKTLMFREAIESRLSYLEYKYTNIYLHDRKANKLKCYKAFLYLYKECHLLEKFCETNVKIFTFYADKAHRTFTKLKAIGESSEDIPTFPQVSNDEYADLISANVNHIKEISKSSFLSFFNEETKPKGEKMLMKICKDNDYSIYTIFFLGFWVGCIFLMIIFLLLFSLISNLNPSEDQEFVAEFPVFRGAILFIVYMWMLAWNVWGWSHYHINYKNIFGFNSHFSPLQKILRRCSFFSSVLLICFTVFAFMRYVYSGDYAENILIVCDIPGAIPWLVLIIYLIFPSNKIFNWQGRRYLFLQLKRILMFWKYDIIFPLVFITDQFISLIRPMQDFEYAICFYTHDIHIESIQQNCLSSKRVINGVIISSIPLIFRMIQCGKQMIVKKNIKGPDAANFLKYLFSFIVVIVSYLYKYYPFMIYTWIVFGFISSMYSFYWDIKMDWGLQDIRTLRKDLHFTKPVVYWSAITLNFIFRLVWTLNFSQAVLNSINFIPEFFPLIIGFLEIIRRAVWNFFRVEKEHILNCDKLEAVEEIEITRVKLKIRELNQEMHSDSSPLITHTFTMSDPNSLYFEFKGNCQEKLKVYQDKLQIARKQRELSLATIKKIRGIESQRVNKSFYSSFFKGNDVGAIN